MGVFLFYFVFFFLQNINRSIVHNFEQFSIQQTVLEKTAVVVKHQFIKCKQCVARKAQ